MKDASPQLVADQAGAGDALPGAPPSSSARGWICLAILMLVYLVYFLDKQIFALLANMLEARLGFTDSQIGVLQGFAYSLPHSVGLLLVGALVDRYPRKALLAVGVVLWSLAAASSGLAFSFGAMAAARAAVGLGEAALIPVSLSILASTFPRERLSLAVGIFYSGPGIGGVLAVLAGGAAISALVRAGGVSAPFVGELEAWQAAFIFTGLPGLLAAAAALTMPFSDRGRRRPGGSARGQAPDGVGAYLKANGGFVATHALAFTFSVICAYTGIAWAAPYFGRAFAWDHAVIGQVVAGGMAASAVGCILWGWVGDRLRARGQRDGLYRIFIVLQLAALPACALAFLAREPVVCVPAFILSMLVYNGFGPLMAPLQLASPERLRGRLTAMYALLNGLIGLGVGPAVAGFLTDYLFHDRAMLGPAIVISITAAAVISVAMLALGRKAYLRALDQQEAPAP